MSWLDILASILVGAAAGKAVNKKLTGDVDSLNSDLIRKIEKERADEQRQYDEDERRRWKEEHKWRDGDD
jgi:LDH2 family malate/lactate/ureidoglycolate dehydrogenase